MLHCLIKLLRLELRPWNEEQASKYDWKGTMDEGTEQSEKKGGPWQLSADRLFQAILAKKALAWAIPGQIWKPLMRMGNNRLYPLSEWTVQGWSSLLKKRRSRNSVHIEYRQFFNQKKNG